MASRNRKQRHQLSQADIDDLRRIWRTTQMSIKDVAHLFGVSPAIAAKALDGKLQPNVTKEQTKTEPYSIPPWFERTGLPEA